MSAASSGGTAGAGPRAPFEGAVRHVYVHVPFCRAKCDYCAGEPECVRVCAPGAIRYVHADECAGHRRRESAAVRAALRRER